MGEPQRTEATPPERVAGVVLCRVGDHRLAFPALQVVAIEAYVPSDRGHPQARVAFELPKLPHGRTMLSEKGEAVVVDALEVQQESFPLLPPPTLMQAVLGGSLRGFATIQEQLWPVLELALFSRFLLRRRPAR